MRKILELPEVFIAFIFIYFEVCFHFVRFGLTLDDLGYKLLFAVTIGGVLGTLIGLLPDFASKVTTMVLTAVVTAYFMVQVVYSGVFSTYLSLTGSIGVANQALDFVDVIWKEITTEWWVLLLLMVPLALLFAFWIKQLECERRRPLLYVLQASGLVLLAVVTQLAIRMDDEPIYSAYAVYKEYTSVDMAVQKLGVSEAFCLDIKAGVADALGIEKTETAFMVETTTAAPTTEEVTTEADTEDITTEEPIDTSPNVLDIDMEALIENESNGNIKALHEYINSVTPTKKNEYTGMFEGYNLIFITAEGFSGFAIDRHLTPTLYKMAHEGFYFKNYYTPLWYGSTLGGEYANLTGMMPKNGGYLSMKKSGANKNDMMFTLSQQLKKQGYQVQGYHNNDYKYYDRHISHVNMGFDWHGTGNGYEPERSSGGTVLWPQSDQHLVDSTFDSFSSQEPFYTYYLTVSGHVMYNFSGNAMAIRHKDVVADLGYSETTRAYLACQYELELALQTLNRKLEEAGIADNTLIVLTADHVPYDNKEVVDELSGGYLNETFEWYQNTLIIWSASMEEPVVVDKYCYSLDVLPTVSNLLGLEYDSRMMVGQDILSDSEGLVMFNDRSFITDKCFYNDNTGEATPIGRAEVTEEYINYIKTIVKNKFSMAQSICDYDYYRYIRAALEE